jgi:hypothetical protein
MSKRHFIALADAIRNHNSAADHPLASGRFTAFTPDQISCIAYFCHKQNPAFNTERWHDYIEGKCGKNGGKIK